MKQLAVQNGDLVIGRGGFTTVTDEAKVRQDLSHALREPIATDRFHPGWGSHLANMIGQVTTPQTKEVIESEVFRVVRNYVISRISLMEQDYRDGLRPTFSSNEVIRSIDAVDVRQDNDRYFVRIILNMLDGSQTSLTTTVQ